MADPLNGVYKARQLSLRRSKAGVAPPAVLGGR
jgi:hypothetical protein